jgi:uncharacterized repeat protein (TIGR01451 family)
MTHSDSHATDLRPHHERRRRRLPWRGATAVKATCAALVACVGVAVFASPAFAHMNTITGVATCGAGTSVDITWTISNDYDSSEVVTLTSYAPTTDSSTPAPSPVSIAATPTGATSESSGTMTQVLTALTTSTATLSVSGTWASTPVFTGPATGTVQLPTTCGVTVAKSVSPGSLTAGSTTPAVYTLDVSNPGGPTSSPVTVTDTVPSGLTYVAGSASCPPLTNGTNPDGSKQPTCSANESGGAVTFVLGASGTQIPSGASYDLTFSVTANPGDPTETIDNTGHFTGPGCTTSAPGCATNIVPLQVTNSSGVTVVKTANTGAVTAGQTAPVTYTLTATNNSKSSTTKSGVVITDVVPSGLTFTTASCGALDVLSTPSCTWTFDAVTGTVTFSLGAGIVAGASDAVTYSATVNASDTTAIVNSAGYTGPGCTTGCRTNTVTITVANISVSKSDSAGSNAVDPGELVTYTVTATNNGDGPGAVTVMDAVPTGTTLTTPAPACPANSTATTCAVTVSGSTISWVISDLPAATSYALAFSVTVNSNASGHIDNTGVYTEPGCTTAGGCSTNTTTNPVVTPSGPFTATSDSPPPTVPTAVKASAAPIADATSVHTGEPWAGSGPYVLGLFAFGLALIGFGQSRRRRSARRIPS